jgi:predicted nucleotide-binding protein
LNKVLKAIYEIDAVLGYNAKIPSKSIQESTGLEISTINRMVDMLRDADLIDALEIAFYSTFKHKWVKLQPKGREIYRATASKAEEPQEVSSKSALSKNPRNVAVVHGRNNSARKAMFAFLRAIGLNPMEWSTLIASTGEGSPYIGRVLEKAFSQAQAIVVLITPDDEGKLRDFLQKPADGPHEKQLTPQARLNVVFEAGMAFGFDSKRTIIAELGVLRPFSDIGGRHTVRLDDTAEKRLDLARRLETAGCPISLGHDWLTAGNFAASTD